MKLKIISPFHNPETGKVHQVGEWFETKEKEFAQRMIDAGIFEGTKTKPAMSEADIQAAAEEDARAKDRQQVEDQTRDINEAAANAMADAKAKSDAHAKAIADLRTKIEADAKAISAVRTQAESDAKAIADLKAKATPPPA